MYSSKKDKFNTDLLKAELAKAKELGQAIKVDELTAFDQANIEFVNQYKDAVEVAAFRDQMKREPPPLKWSAPIVRKAEDHGWLLRDPSPKRLS